MSQTLTFYDPETDVAVEVCLSLEDIARAKTDMAFATKLMNAAAKEKQHQQQRTLNTESDSERTAVNQSRVAVSQIVAAVPEAGPSSGPPRGPCSSTTAKSSSSETPTEEDVPAVHDSSVSEVEGVDSDPVEAGVYRWSDRCVILLLETYRSYHERLTSGKQSQKKTWVQIADALKDKGYNVTGPQCAATVRSLKKTYKAVKDHNNKSGNDRRTWQCFMAIDEMFATAAWAEPVAIASSAGLSDQDKDSACSDSGCVPDPQKRKASMANLLVKRLKLKEKVEEEKAKRHQERMEMENKRMKLDARLVTALEAIAGQNQNRDNLFS